MKVSIKPDGTIDFDGANTSQVIEVLQALKNKNAVVPFKTKEKQIAINIKKPKQNRDFRKSPERNNEQHEYAKDASPLPLGIPYDVYANQKILLISFDNDGDIQKHDSLQIECRKAVVRLFFENGNKPMALPSIRAKLLKDGGVTYKSINTYTNHLVRTGVLAKDKNTNTLHISKYFIGLIANEE